MPTIPGTRLYRWFERSTFLDLILTSISTLVLVATAINYFLTDGRRMLGWIVAAAAFLIVGGSFLKYRVAKRHERAASYMENYDGLHAALHVLFAATDGEIRRESLHEAARDTGLRITMHRVEIPDRSPPELVQILPYIGDSGGEAGRRFAIHCGIIGLAARNQKVIIAERLNDDYEGFIEEMITTWGYTHDQARELGYDRFSWMAIPIINEENNKETLAVVYLDAKPRGVFQTPSARSIIIDSCYGITSYIHERYPE